MVGATAGAATAFRGSDRGIRPLDYPPVNLQSRQRGSISSDPATTRPPRPLTPSDAEEAAASADDLEPKGHCHHKWTATFISCQLWWSLRPPPNATRRGPFPIRESARSIFLRLGPAFFTARFHFSLRLPRLLSPRIEPRNPVPPQPGHGPAFCLACVFLAIGRLSYVP